MSLVSYNLDSSLAQTVVPDPVTGHSMTAPQDPLELGSPVPQSMYVISDSSERKTYDSLASLRLQAFGLGMLICKSLIQRNAISSSSMQLELSNRSRPLSNESVPSTRSKVD